MRHKKKSIWMEIDTSDPYLLPVRIADSAREMAQESGVKEMNIRTMAFKVEKGIHKKSRFIRVYVDDED